MVVYSPYYSVIMYYNDPPPQCEIQMLKYNLKLKYRAIHVRLCLFLYMFLDDFRSTELCRILLE